MYNINITPRAYEDLVTIKNYINDNLLSPQSSIKTIKAIMSKIHLLSTLPLSGQALGAVLNIHTDYRFLVCNKYLIFYRVLASDVLIIRIIYAKRDYAKLLFTEYDEHLQDIDIAKLHEQ